MTDPCKPCVGRLASIYLSRSRSRTSLSRSPKGRRSGSPTLRNLLIPNVTSSPRGGSIVQGAVLIGEDVYQKSNNYGNCCMRNSMLRQGVPSSPYLQGSVINNVVYQSGCHLDEESHRMFKVSKYRCSPKAMSPPPSNVFSAQHSSNTISYYEPLSVPTVEIVRTIVEPTYIEKPVVIEKPILIEQPIEIIKEVQQVVKGGCEEHHIVIEQLSQQLKLWKSEADKLRQDARNIYEYEQKLIEKERTIVSIKNTKNDLEAKLKEFELRFREKEEIIIKITSQLNSKDGEIVELGSKAYRFEQILKECQEENTLIKTRMVERERTIHEIENEIIKYRRICKEKDDEIAAWKGKFQTLEGVNEQVKKELSLKSRTIVELEEQCNKYKGEIENRDKIIYQKEQEITRWRSEFKTIQEEAENWKRKYTQIQESEERFKSELLLKSKRITEFESELERVTIIIKETERVVVERDERIKKFQNELEQSKSNYRTLEETYKKISHELEIRNNRVHELEKEIQRYQREIQSLQTSITSFEKDTARYNSDLQSKTVMITELERELNKMREELQERTKVSQNLEREVARFRSEYERLQRANDGLESQVKQFKNDIDGLRQKIREYEERITKIQSEFDNQARQLQDREKENSRYKHEFESTSRKSQEFDRDLTRIKGELEQKNRKTMEMESSLRDRDGEIHGLKSKLRYFEESESNLKNELKEKQRIIELHLTQIEKLGDDSKGGSRRVKELEEEITRIRKQWEQRILSVEAEMRQKDLRITEQEDIIRILRVDLDNSRNQNEHEMRRRTTRHEELIIEHKGCQAKIALLAEELERLTFENEGYLRDAEIYKKKYVDSSNMLEANNTMANYVLTCILLEVMYEKAKPAFTEKSRKSISGQFKELGESVRSIERRIKETEEI